MDTTWRTIRYQTLSASEIGPRSATGLLLRGIFGWDGRGRALVRLELVRFGTFGEMERERESLCACTRACRCDFDEGAFSMLI